MTIIYLVTHILTFFTDVLVIMNLVLIPVIESRQVNGSVEALLDSLKWCGIREDEEYTSTHPTRQAYNAFSHHQRLAELFRNVYKSAKVAFAKELIEKKVITSQQNRAMPLINKDMCVCVSAQPRRLSKLGLVFTSENCEEVH
ncbi:hypothetical protein PsorP6_015316 [Peronosclerospora sorghi]|uniref:Uncharacterized protein n=1 Tax=Peronosclerospora sorghi TaxID=230839 RepID=A0ACC0VUA4_9STRA|nr:hypothetical protein PsorP6_015316 [Peronosclerospora sorghi]